MGIKVEFNPDLALRAYGTLNRTAAECLPKKLEIRQEYEFLKEGQRVYWLEGEIPLLETKGKQQLSNPLASIKILETTHFIRPDGKVYTKGRYQINQIFEDEEIHFNGFKKIR